MKQDLVLKITARLMQLEHGPFRRPPGSVQKMRKKNSKYKGGKIFHNINQKKKLSMAILLLLSRRNHVEGN